MTDLRPRSELTGSVRARRGAHRPAPSRVVALVPVLLVLGAVGVLAVGVWLVTGLSGRSADDAVASSAAVAASSAPVTGPEAPAAPPAGGTATPSAPSSTASVDPSAPAPSTPAAEPAAEPEPSTAASTTTAPPPPEPTAEVDTDVPVVVLNATRTQGLAASTARDLERDGWTVASTGNERSGDVDATVVRYPDADLEATAAAVAASLGDDVETVLDDDAESGSVTVVAGADQAG